MARQMMGTLDTETQEAIVSLIRAARVEGIVAGLEMADKFIRVTKNRKDMEAMIKAAILAARA